MRPAPGRKTLAVSTSNMTRQHLTILFCLFFVYVFGQTSNSCTCSAIIDVEFKGDISLLRHPTRTEVTKFRHNFKEEDFLFLTLTRDSADFFRVVISHSIDDKDEKKGWLKKSPEIGTYTRNYSDSLRLFSKPDLKSKIMTTVPTWIPELYRIKKCSGKWAFVELNYKGQTYSGWLPSDKQCANSYSNCN
jgi:hypothetical protein